MITDKLLLNPLAARQRLEEHWKEEHQRRAGRRAPAPIPLGGVGV